MAEVLQPRTPPHSIEAEQSVLGALLMDNAVHPDVAALVREPDFYSAEHRIIYRAIGELVAASKPADVVTVFEAVRGRLDAACESPLGYLNALSASVASPRAGATYAAIVAERARRRALMAIGQDLADRAMRMAEQDAPTAGLVDEAVTSLLALADGAAVRSDPVDLGDFLVPWLDDLQERAEGRNLPFATGLADLDRLTAGGARRGELWVIGARPSMGKTAFVLQLCRTVGVAHQVLLLSQEDSLLSSTARFVASAGRVNLADLRNPQAAPGSMWAGVTDGVADLTPLQVAMDDQTGLNLADVRRKAQQVKRKHGRLDLLVVDYLQLMDDEGPNRNISLGYLANGLKRFAKQYGCWVVLLSQLNREADKRNGPPQMSDLRDSGDIEGAADLIGLLHREYMRKPNADNKHWAQLHVCKQKNGPTDTLNLFFDGAYQQFGNWDGPAPRRSMGAE
jgi:replicative DNA helicase